MTQPVVGLHKNSEVTMTYDRLYSVDVFRLINGITHADYAFGRKQSSEQYQSIQLCRWMGPMRPSAGRLPHSG